MYKPLSEMKDDATRVRASLLRVCLERAIDWDKYDKLVKDGLAMDYDDILEYLDKNIVERSKIDKAIAEIEQFQSKLQPIKHTDNYEDIINEGKDLACDYILEILENIGE